jgi:MFS-type transporter involved in bile tolerance (Atg22 family)
VYVLMIVPAGLLVMRLGQQRLVHAVSAHRPFSFGETFRFLGGEPRAAYAIALLAFTEMTMKGAVIAVPRYLMKNLELNDAELLMVLALGALGAAAGLIWVMRWLTRRASGRVMRLTLAAVACTLLLLALLQPMAIAVGRATGAGLPTQIGTSDLLGLALALLAALVLGLCFSLAPVAARAVLTDTAPVGQHARVFASQATLAHAAVIVPLLLAGAGTQYAGPRPILALLGLTGLALLLVLERLWPRQRGAERQPSATTTLTYS